MSEKNGQDAKPKNWFMRHKIITVLLVIFVLGIIGSAMGGGDKSSYSSSQNNAVKQQDEPPIVVTASKMLADYEANGVAADALYKNKIVEVSGTIKDISKDILDTPYIALESGDMIFSVQCMFDKSDQSELASLSKNTKITLRGKVSGKLGNVLVKDCSIVE